MKTLKGWYESNARSFDDYVMPFDEIGECLYWYFLEVLPPIYKSGGFLVNEPVSYNEHGQTYAGYYQCNDKYYYLGDIAVSQWGETVKLLKEVIR